MLKTIKEGWVEICFAFQEWQILLERDEIDKRNLYFFMLPQGLNFLHLIEENNKRNANKVTRL